VTDPFRDELAASVARTAELEAENEELRGRLDAVETAKTKGDREAEETIGTSRGLASRLQHEIKELEERLVRVKTEANERVARAVQAQSKPTSAPTLPVNSAGVLILTFAVGVVVGYLTHC
jgi:hypothetical protein